MRFYLLALLERSTTRDTLVLYVPALQRLFA